MSTDKEIGKLEKAKLRSKKAIPIEAGSFIVVVLGLLIVSRFAFVPVWVTAISIGLILFTLIGDIINLIYCRRHMRHYEILPAKEMQKKYGLYAENRPEIKIDSMKVPEYLRDLIPMAEKWGVGDDIIRPDIEEKTSETEKQAFQTALRDRTKQVNDWLDSFTREQPMSEEAGYFMYMLEALAEMHLWPDNPAK
jgi:hypothetical protein